MIITLGSMTNKLKTILDRLTTDRAAALEYLTSISTWTSSTNAKVPDAAAWTNALATQLNNYTPGALKCVQYTATGAFTFTVPTNTTCVWVTLQGAGGSGANGSGTNYQYGGGGGGAGLCLWRVPYQVTGGATVTGTVGTGGAAAATASAFGTDGTASVFGNLSASGGQKGGYGGAFQSIGGRGGGPSDLLGTYVNDSQQGSNNGRAYIYGWILPGGSGGYGYTYQSGGNMQWFGGITGSRCGAYSGGTAGVPGGGGGGASWFGNGGNGGTSGYNGTAGGTGAGGGGTYYNPSTYTSGAGGNGFVRIEYIA